MSAHHRRPARARCAIPAGLWLDGDRRLLDRRRASRSATGWSRRGSWSTSSSTPSSRRTSPPTAQFLVRGVPSHGYGFVYPVLIAPAWRLFTSIPDAYTAAKAINAVLMSLAAIPAYFLARRVLPAGLSLVAALLAVLVPSMLYTGMLMTENAFYPLFLLAAFLLVAHARARRPPFRQIALLAVCGVAFETRAQAVALFAAVATAPILLALVERRGARATLRRYGWLYGLLGGGAALALAGTVAAGRSPLSLLGAYRAATSSSLHGQRRPPLLPLPRRRARPLPRHPPVRRAARALARASPAEPRRPCVRRRVARDLRSGCSPRSPRSPRRASSTGSRSGTCSTSRRSR